MPTTNVDVTINFENIARLPGTSQGGRVVIQGTDVDQYIQYSNNNISVDNGDTLQFTALSSSSGDPSLSGIEWDHNDFINSAKGSLIYQPNNSAGANIAFTANNNSQQDITDNLTMAIDFTYAGDQFRAIWDPEIRVGGGSNS